MDANVLGNDVHNINLLTVIASESYDSFARSLQSELAEAVADRPRVVNAELFRDKILSDGNGNELPVDPELAQSIHFDLIAGGTENIQCRFHCGSPVCSLVGIFS